MAPVKAAFSLEAVEEARPSEEMPGLPYMKDELRRPMMLLVKASAKK
ncbi:MAG: methyltransferase [Eubacteriales bacterium]|nr:methyltransferase [Eubacteriales bacterium]